MARGIPGVLSDAQARAAFQSILDDPRTGGEASMSLFPNGVDVDWRVLAEAGDTVTVGLGEWTERGPASTNAFLLSLRRDGNDWSTDGWGDCRLLAPVLEDGRVWARVDGYRLAGPRSLEVDVSEVQCTSGRDPKEYLHSPTVVETGDSVTLSWTSTSAEGAIVAKGTHRSRGRSNSMRHSGQRWSWTAPSIHLDRFRAANESASYVLAAMSTWAYAISGYLCVGGTDLQG